MKNYYIYYYKEFENKINDLKNNFYDFVVSPGFYLKVSDNPDEVDTSIFKPLHYKEYVEAENEEDALYFALNALQMVYFNEKSGFLPAILYDFLRNLRLYNQKTVKEDFIDTLRKRFSGVVDNMCNQILRKDSITGFVNVVSDINNTNFEINPLLEEKIESDNCLAKEFIEDTQQKLNSVSLNSVPVLATNHSDYQNSSYYAIMANLKRFNNIVKDFWLCPENYFYNENTLKIPNGRNVTYTKIKTDNGIEFLSLNGDGNHRNIFVNLIKNITSIDKFQTNNPIKIQKFHYNKLVKVSENIDKLQKMYPDLKIVMYNDYLKEFLFMYSGNETVTVSLNDLIYKNADEINKEYFNKSFANIFVRAIKKGFKR